jgi:Spy/CpxP family protein refolding chaperone
MMGPGYDGWNMMGYGSDYGPHMRGYGDEGALSSENAAKIDAARDKFYTETRELRDKIYDTRIALRSELGKDQPSKDKATALQKQLSQLQSEFDQKALAYHLTVDKLIPNDDQGRGFRGGYCW